MTTLPEALSVISKHGATYAGEARLVRWGDTSSSGMTVTFELHIDDARAENPFKAAGKSRPRFTMIAVPIADTDEEAPAEQGRSSEVEHADLARTAGGSSPPAPSKRAWRDLSRSQQAGIKCSDEQFRQWVSTRIDGALEDVTSDVAASNVRYFCGVATRAELDSDTVAADRWDMLLTEYDMATGRLARG